MFEFFLFLPLKEVAVKQFMYKKQNKTLLKQQKLLLVFVHFSSWSSDVGLTVHSSSVDVFSVVFCTKIFCNKYGTVF